MALVSLREGQVRTLAQRGKRGQRAAKLAQDPNRFLSAVQIGVTLGDPALPARSAPRPWRRADLGAAPRSTCPPGSPSPLSFARGHRGDLLLHAGPWRACSQTDRAAAAGACRAGGRPILDRIAILARPLVWLLSRSMNLVVRILGGNPRASRDVMT